MAIDGDFHMAMDIFDSWLAKHPRKSIDKYVEQFLMAQFIGDEPAPRDVSFEELWAWFEQFREAG